MAKLNVKIGQTTFKNPVVLASGTFDQSIATKIDLNQLGGLVTKTITLDEKHGNPLPHIFKTKYGWLNSVGLKNPGIEKYLNKELPFWQKFDTEIITSIGGESEKEYIELAHKLEGKVKTIEVNVSCPNVAHGGMNFGTDIPLLKRLVKNIRKNFSGTIIVKLSPNVDDITQTAEIAIKNGADAVTIANTVLGLAIDRQNKKPIFGRITAGYSGGAIKPIALKNVYQVYKKLKCQILGSGGIEDIDDAIDFILVGAQIVQIGSANLLEPQTAIKIIDGLTQHLEKNNYSSINEIKGLI